MTIPSIVWSLLTVIAAVGLAYLFLTRTALGRGFKVPLRQLARKPVTIQYPEIKRDPQPRFHGRHQLNFYEDGLEKCIGCELCAWACPADAIFVQGADNTADARFSPGERYASDYQINYNRCILCALCIEACPTRALTMTRDYEFSADTREGLIYTKERLLATPPAGTDPTPHTDEEVRARGINYYGGLAATPPELTGGDYAPAGPRPMRRASAAVGGLSERAASAPRRAGDTPIGSPGDQRAVPTGADSSHMREAGGDAQAPAFRDDSGRHLGASGDRTRDADGRVIEGDEPRLTDGAGGSLDAREREDERAGVSGGMPAEPQLEREPQRRTEQPDDATQPFPQDVSGGHQPGGVAHTESEARPSREAPEASPEDGPQHPSEDHPGDAADRGEDERR